MTTGERRRSRHSSSISSSSPSSPEKTSKDGAASNLRGDPPPSPFMKMLPSDHAASPKRLPLNATATRSNRSFPNPFDHSFDRRKSNPSSSGDGGAEAANGGALAVALVRTATSGSVHSMMGASGGAAPDSCGSEELGRVSSVRRQGGSATACLSPMSVEAPADEASKAAAAPERTSPALPLSEISAATGYRPPPLPPALQSESPNLDRSVQVGRWSISGSARQPHSLRTLNPPPAVDGGRRAEQRPAGGARRRTPSPKATAGPPAP